MAKDYINMNGAAFLSGGSIHTLTMTEFVAQGIETGIYAKYPRKQKEMLTAIWKLANPEAKKKK